MKRILMAAAAATAMLGAGAAQAAVTPDSETLVYNLSGEVQSVCTLTPDGPVNFTVNMTNYGNQGLTGFAYSCNSPYKVNVKSLNGGLKHVESSGAIVLEYDIKLVGLTANVGFNFDTLDSEDIDGAGVDVIVNNSWTNILLNAGAQAATMEIDTPPLSQQAVAGTYTDQVTVTLTADL